MTEKELRKLNRFQLLELLVAQTERADKLEEKLEKAEALLNSRDLQMSVVGSIAEASLKLGGVFEAAQRSADLFLDAAKDRADELVAQAQERAERIEQEAWKRAEKIIEDAKTEAGVSGPKRSIFRNHDK